MRVVSTKRRILKSEVRLTLLEACAMNQLMQDLITQERSETVYSLGIQAEVSPGVEGAESR